MLTGLIAALLSVSAVRTVKLVRGGRSARAYAKQWPQPDARSSALRKPQRASSMPPSPSG